ncbi:hypothetical protein FB567DRAFT_598555 [Paraphoma chrysanthemicola]|uniref:Uncharacterized protein n=1 Tax=Paraphoma chrysanthemicola TaxID=798071 RepID=A0A8K0QVJ7_9PLEO|nr:hypothetical protein FB567DRAFT_598555 [Paraphoma chrysanthemicola]
MLFNTLIPAISFTATINIPSHVDSGQFHPSVKGRAIRGGDWITIDPSGGILRLHLDTLIKTDDDTPEYIRISATGAEVAIPEVMAVIGAVPGAKAVSYGDFQATSSWSFQTGSKKYAELENAVYVGSTSLKPGSEKGTIVVGFKIAKVISTKTNISV